MDKYTKQAGDVTYDSDAEADDEFERSMVGSPQPQQDYVDGESDHPSESEDSQSMDGEDTPTTQGWTERDGRSPRGDIMAWSEADVADFISSLSVQMKPYCQAFMDEGVTGDALCALQHDELRELGVVSVGHRLTILKAVYEQKLKTGVKMQEGDYVPLSVEGDKGDMTATQDDIARIIESIRLRDQRIIAAEAELRAMKQDLDRIVDENRRLREETLPTLRHLKDQRTPLPDPNSITLPSPREAEMPKPGSMSAAVPQSDRKLNRRSSIKKLFLGNQKSPTHPPVHAPFSAPIRDDNAHLEASAAAMAASSHLTASMTSQASPNDTGSQPLSPASPAYSNQPSSGGSHYGSVSHSNLRNNSRSTYDDPGSAGSTSWTQSHASMIERPGSATANRVRRTAPTPSPRDEDMPSSAKEKDNPQVELFKSFRVSIDDPCEVVLPVALKRYNIHDDWRQYSLYIVYGDQERCLGLREKPLLLFKQLDKEGRKPMFMLRRHASPQDGWSGKVSSNGGQTPGGVL